MNMKQAGFTLIELVMVIVILGILAAVAIPKYVDLTSKADQAATDGVAGALASAAAANYAARVISAGGVAVTSCMNVTSALASMPTGFTVVTTAVAALTTVGAPGTCTVNGGGSTTQNFTAIGA